MRHASRLARLEKIAGKDSCPACRIHSRYRWLNPAQPHEPGPFLADTCELCGAVTRLSLAPYDEGARAMLRLVCSGGLERLFTQPRAWAAFQWLVLWPARHDRRKSRRREQNRDCRAASSDPPIPNTRSCKPSPGIKLRRKLTEEYEATLGRLLQDLHRRYGEDPFPEIDAQIQAARGPDFESLYRDEPFAPEVDANLLSEIKGEADLWAKCAEAERIILGEARDQTEEALAECARRASALVGEARRRHEEREAERKREQVINIPSRGRLSECKVEPPACVSASPPEPQAQDSPPAEEFDWRELLDIFGPPIPVL